MKNFKSLINEANKEIQKIISFIEEHEEAFDSTNLKLYDIAWNDDIQSKYNLDDKEYSRLFDWYCEDEYRFYQEWREEENLKNEHSQIGRTSSFYFHDEEIVQMNRFKIDYEASIDNCINNYINTCSDLTSIVNDKGLLDFKMLTSMLKKSNKYYIEGYIEQMKYDLMDIIQDDLYNQVVSDLEDTIKDYNYIKTFKENQVNNFDEYIKCHMEDITTV